MDFFGAGNSKISICYKYCKNSLPYNKNSKWKRFYFENQLVFCDPDNTSLILLWKDLSQDFGAYNSCFHCASFCW